MNYQRIIGLDFGTKRIGIALSDLLMITAQGLESYTRTDNEKLDLQHIAQICADNDVKLIVAGMPKNMNGTLGPSAEMCKNLGDKLSRRTGIPIVYEDERLTSVYAERLLIEQDVSRKKRRQVIDKMAAVEILQTYLDRNRK